MTSTLDDTLVQLLLWERDQVAIVGTGSQARKVRDLLFDSLRIRTDDIPGFSSTEVPVDRSLYLVCATPSDEACRVLSERGVQSSCILKGERIAESLEGNPGTLLYAHLGLEPIGPPPCPIDFVAALHHCVEQLRSLYLRVATWTNADIALLTACSVAYLNLRRHRYVYQVGPNRRLLYPSTGRCGGVSLTATLQNHPVVRLRVNHEGFARPIYRLLALQKSASIDEIPLLAIASILLDENDCIGGNPFCFLVPYLPRLEWNEYYVLKVERSWCELRESILQRNFHYSEFDFVPERITAAQWGVMSATEWNSLPIGEKVDWYIAVVDSEIERTSNKFKCVQRAPLSDLLGGLRQTLSKLGWPSVSSVPRLNSLPMDRIYTYEERAKIFLEKGVSDTETDSR